LAAGDSSRLGRPKQELLYRNETLLEHAVACSLRIAAPGPRSAGVKVIDRDKTYCDEYLEVLLNENADEGMASSVRLAVKNSLDAEAIILMVCDQPFVTSDILMNLIETYLNTGKGIVACSYANTFGPPALFSKKYFPELLQLRGDVGARKVIEHHPEDTALIDFPKGNIDIDTEADYEFLTKSIVQND